jgi:hypothetical protein
MNKANDDQFEVREVSHLLILRDVMDDRLQAMRDASDEHCKSLGDKAGLRALDALIEVLARPDETIPGRAIVLATMFLFVSALETAISPEEMDEEFDEEPAPMGSPMGERVRCLMGKSHGNPGSSEKVLKFPPALPIKMMSQTGGTHENAHRLAPPLRPRGPLPLRLRGR